MHPADPVDRYELPWTSFAEFFGSRGDSARFYLAELRSEQDRRQWTVGEWRLLVADTVTCLRVAGVNPGDSVAVLLGNRAEALVVAYASWVLGACYVPLNAEDSVARQEFILRDSAACLVVVSGSADRVPQEHTARVMSFAELQAHSARVEVTESTEVGLDQEALRVYTSGTTGDPKGVVLTARNLLVDCDALATATGWGATTRVLTVLPIHHVNGLIISSLLVWYIAGSTVLCDRFRSDRFWQNARDEGATVASLVPSLLEFLNRTQGASVPPTFREVLCGAGPLLPETALEFERRHGVPVRHLFGMSETTAVATMMPRLANDQRRYWHTEFGFPSIGPAIDHADVTILGQQDHELPEGQRGEIAIRGAMVMKGYAGHPSPEGHRWLRTGDEGFWRLGPGGKRFFFVTGRLKELIIRGGSNISPIEIDAVICSHPGVEFGMAVPFDNRFYGEEIAAYVVPRDGEIATQEFLDYCAQYLDFARCPKVLVHGEDVPFTSTGKPKRIELSRRLAPQLEQYRDAQFRRSRAGRASTPQSVEPNQGTADGR